MASSLLQGVARLVGEGYDRPDADSTEALDINYARVNEWMVERRLIPSDWPRRLRALQAETARRWSSSGPLLVEAVRALEEGREASGAPPPLPASSVSAALGGGLAGGAPALEDAEPVGYREARWARDALARTASKSLLGGPRGEAGEWAKVAGAYERSALRVAEAGAALARAADHQAPAAAKAAERARAGAAEASKRAAEARRAAATATAEGRAGLDASGIDPGEAEAALGGGVGRGGAGRDGEAAAVRTLLLEAANRNLPPLADSLAHDLEASEALRAVAEAYAAGVAQAGALDDGERDEEGEGGEESQDIVAAGVLPALRCALRGEVPGRYGRDPAERGEGGISAPRPADGAEGYAAHVEGGVPKSRSAAGVFDLDLADLESSPAGLSDGKGDADGIEGGEAPALQWDLDLSGAREEGVGGEGAGEGGDAPASVILDVSWDIAIDAAGNRAGKGAGGGNDEGEEGAALTAPSEAPAPGASRWAPYASAVSHAIATDRAYRYALETDLLELQAFCARASEEALEGAGGGGGGGGGGGPAAPTASTARACSVLSSAPCAALLRDPAAVALARDACSAAAAGLRAPALRRLAGLAGGGRALARSVEALLEPRARARRWEAVAREADARGRAAQRALVEARGAEREAGRAAREARQLVELALGEKLKRPVRVVGGGLKAAEAKEAKA